MTKRITFGLCVIHVLAIAVGLVLPRSSNVVADEFALKIQETINTNAVITWTNQVQNQIYPSAITFRFNPSGTYTCLVEVVDGSVTNIVVNKTITSATDGMFLPESRRWVTGTNVIRITIPQASPTVTNWTTIFMSKDEDQ